MVKLKESEYRAHLEKMAEYLVQNGIEEAGEIMESSLEEAGYVIEDIFWYFSLLEQGDSPNRLESLPWKLAKKHDLEWRSEVRSEYIEYRSRVLGMFDEDTVLEAMPRAIESDSGPKDDEGYICTSEDEIGPYGASVGLVEGDSGDEDDYYMGSINYEDDEEGDIIEFEDPKELEPLTEPEPVTAPSTQPVPVPPSHPEPVQEANSGDDYYTRMFSDFDKDESVVWIEDNKIQSKPVPKKKKRKHLDEDVLNTEFYKEAIFKEKIYRWYEKLEEMVKLW